MKILNSCEGWLYVAINGFYYPDNFSGEGWRISFAGKSLWLMFRNTLELWCSLVAHKDVMSLASIFIFAWWSVDMCGDSVLCKHYIYKKQFLCCILLSHCFHTRTYSLFWKHWAAFINLLVMLHVNVCVRLFVFVSLFKVKCLLKSWSESVTCI